MAETIGRVEFIVGLDGKRLTQEAKAQGAKLAKMGDEAGKEYGTEFGEGAEGTIDKSLNKAMQRAQKKFAKEGTLAGKTYAKHIDAEAVEAFRKMERETIKALSNKKGFEKFAKNFDIVDDAVTQLTENVRRLGQQNILRVEIDPETKEELSFLDKFFDDFEAGPAMQQVDKWTRSLKEMDAQTKKARDSNEALKIQFDRLRASVDNTSFDRLAAHFGSAEKAAAGLNQKMKDLAEGGAVTRREYDRFNITLEKQVERHKEALAAAKKAADGQADIAGKLKLSADEAKRLDVAMANLNSKMGDAGAFKRYVKQVGGVRNAHRDLSGEIAGMAAVFKLPAKAVEGLGRKLTNLADSFESASKSGGDSEGGFGAMLKKLATAKGGMSVGAMAALIAGAIGPAMVAVQGLVAAISALIGVVGAALAGAAAIGSAALVGLVWTVWKATEAIGMMKDEFPAAQAGMDALAEASKADSAAFARAWGPALADFTQALAKVWRDDKMGERAGEAMGKVTAAFTGVINSPAYKAFQTAMETSIPNSIANLGGGLANLASGFLNIVAAAGPALERVSELFKNFTDEWAKAMQADADSGELQKTIDGLVDDLLLLLDTVKRVWDATTKFFDSGRASGRRLLDMIGDTFDKWSEWMDSVEGNKALETFFASGEATIGALLDILPDIQKAFDSVVTQEAIDRTVELIDQLGQLVSGPAAELIQLFENLDVFGVLATVLNDLLIPLKPLFDLLTPIAGIIGMLVELVGRFAGAILTFLTPALIPMRFAFEILNTAIQTFLEWSQPMFDAIEEIGTAIFEAADAIWVALEPAIKDLMDSFLALLPSPEELARILRENVIPMIQSLRDWIVDKLIPKLQAFMDKIGDLIEEHGGWEQIMEDVETGMRGLKGFVDNVLIPALDILLGVIEGMVGAWEALDGAVRAVKTALIIIEGAFRGFFNAFSGVPGWISDTIGALGTLIGLQGEAQRGRAGGGDFASGGIVHAGQRIRVGEAGIEAIVPLARPLAMVDPSVRALSAFAQGLTYRGAGGGSGGTAIAGATPAPGRVVNIAEGAVVVQGVLDPDRAAVGVVNRIAERIG